MVNNIYVGMRYVPVFDENWSSDNAYEALTMVTVNGNTYISKTAVPEGTEITNTTYWAQMYVASAEVAKLQAQVDTIQSQLDTVGSGGTWKSAEEFGIKPDGTDITPLLATIPANTPNLAFPAGTYTMSANATLSNVGAVMFAPGTTFTKTLTVSNAIVDYPTANVTCNQCPTVIEPNQSVLISPSLVIGGSATITTGTNCTIISCDVPQLTYNATAVISMIGGTLGGVSATQQSTLCKLSLTEVTYAGDAPTNPPHTICHECQGICWAVEEAYSTTFTPGDYLVYNAYNCIITGIEVFNAYHCTGTPKMILRCFDHSTITLNNDVSYPAVCEDSFISLPNGANRQDPITNQSHWQNVTITTSQNGTASVTFNLSSSNVTFISVLAGGGVTINFGQTSTATGYGTAIGCSAGTVSDRWVAINTPLGTPLPTGGSTPVQGSSRYEVGWGLVASPNDISQPGLNGVNGNNICVRLFKDGQPLTTSDTDSWGNYANPVYLPNGKTVQGWLSTTGGMENASLGLYQWTQGSNFNAFIPFFLYLELADNSSPDDRLVFILPFQCKTLSASPPSNVLLPLLFKNHLYTTQTLPSPCIYIVSNASGGFEIEAYDAIGTPVQITAVSILMGGENTLNPNIIYNSSQRTCSFSTIPPASISPYAAKVTFQYPDAVSPKTYTMQPIPLFVSAE